MIAQGLRLGLQSSELRSQRELQRGEGLVGWVWLGFCAEEADP